jgi:hypothetical protein
MSYLPQPPRAWSRVQSIPYCTDPLLPSSPKYTVYVPRTKQTLPPSIADAQDKIIYKGNILQYKNNSSNLTKNQRFSQIAKGMWINRQKSYATQSQTYTNPNTSSLYRVNSVTISPNTNPGSVNNESGPYQYGIPNPFGCNSSDIVDGGSLICNTLAQPCTNELIKVYPIQKCFPITASNVPGFSNPSVTKFLCWDSKMNTWYPRNKLNMNNSGNKWPTNYKAFVSACKPIN